MATETISSEERDVIDYQLELIKVKLLEQFGDFAKGISIEWETDSEDNLLHIGATFIIGAEGTLSDTMFHGEADVLRHVVMKLVHNIERRLYDLLPVYKTEPQTAGVKIRIDGHLPKGVIWMHPEVYASLPQPELRNLLTHQP